MMMVTDAIPLAWLVHAVLIVLAIEATVLAVHHRRSGRGLAPRHWAPMLLAGLGLAVALSLAVHGAPAAWIAVALAAAGAAHATDLASRWRCISKVSMTERSA